MVTTKLSEICQVNWGDTAVTKASYVAIGYSAYSASGCDGFLPYYDHDGTGIVLSAIGAQCGKIWLAREKWSCIKNTIYLKSKSEHADIHYLYYALSDPSVWPKRGAAQPFISQSDARNVEVHLPSLSIQRRIAGILSTYDDLIENSQRRIEILEEMARRLYREWFVHFRFPGHENCTFVESPLGEIPEGWEVRNVKDLATVIYGFPFASKRFNTAGNGAPVIRIRDIPSGYSSTFTEEEVESKYHVKNGHILIGMDGDFHMCIWSSGHAVQNQRVARFEPIEGVSKYYLFLALETPIRDFNKAIVGTTVAHLGDMHIKTIQLVFPSPELNQRALNIFEPISDQVIALKRQIQNLRRTRDLLLPRLLSGQIDVEKLLEPGPAEP